MTFLKLYLIAFVVFFAIDMLWLGLIAKNLYSRHLGFIMAPQVKWVAAIIFYLLFIVGLVFFVIQPAIEKNSLTYAVFAGLLFGLITYATYDLTNLATLNNWPIQITIIDLAWGTFPWHGRLHHHIRSREVTHGTQSYLTAPIFTRLSSRAPKQLISEKAHLNKINVFPVPDGDTGSNMGYLMQTIVLESKMSDSVSDTMESIANAAINGSRGNSGIIFSEYINGLFERLKGKIAITTHDSRGRRRQRRETRVSSDDESRRRNDFNRLAQSVRPQSKWPISTLISASRFSKAQTALAETPNELKVLKDNHVVDAGAAGFTAFLEGIHHYFETGEFAADIHRRQIDDEIAETPNPHDMEPSSNGIAPKGMIINRQNRKAELKAIFETDGSSLIVSGRADKMRLHIHTDRPDRFFLKLSNTGRSSSKKSTTCCVKSTRSKRVIRRLADRHRFDRRYSNGAYGRVRGSPDSRQFARRRRQLPRQSHDFFRNVLRHLEARDSRFPPAAPSQKPSNARSTSSPIITTMSSLSASHPNFLARSTPSFNTPRTVRRFNVFDSRQNSGAQGLARFRSCENGSKTAIPSTRSSKRTWTTLPDRTKIFVSLHTLKYMVRQGRISKMKGSRRESHEHEADHLASPKTDPERFKTRPSVSKEPRKRFSDCFKTQTGRFLRHRSRARSNIAPNVSGVEKIERTAWQDGSEYITSISPIVAMNAGHRRRRRRRYLRKSWED
ncbi:MAG: DUF2177 family protein [Bacillus subtilis]|nr:DUF2177 family protein [Bacillus subtilis]